MPKSNKRRVLHMTAQSIVMYGAPVYHRTFQMKKSRENLLRCNEVWHLGCVARIDPCQVTTIVGVNPLHLLSQESYRKRVQLEDEDKKGETLKLWQEEWQSLEEAAWTQRLIENVGVWVSHKGGRGGQIDYYTIQFLTGHGSFIKYLQRIGKWETVTCIMYVLWWRGRRRAHLLQMWEMWDADRQKLSTLTDEQLTPETVVERMVESEIKQIGGQWQDMSPISWRKKRNREQM